MQKERWDFAQQNELRFWENWFKNQGINLNNQSGKEKILEYNRQYLKGIPHGHNLAYFRDKIIADIGCGPNPTMAVNGLKCEKVYCVDPLIDAYQQLIDYREFGFDYIKSTGEQIPLVDSSVDIVLCLNALDHMDQPTTAIREFDRILKKDGELYLHLIFNEGDEQCHPHSIDFKDLINMLDYAGIHVWQSDIRCKYDGVLEARSASLVCRKYSKQNYFRNKKICIYGAGEAGKRLFLQAIKSIPLDQVECFSDSNSILWGTFKEGKEVVPFERICDLVRGGKMSILIASTTGLKEISAGFQNMGFREGLDYFNGLSLFNVSL